MTTYTKSLATDFAGSLNVTQFCNEIETSNIASAILQGVNTAGDVVDIIFNNSLSGPDLSTLNALITNHVPSSAKSKTNFFIVSANKTATSTSYSRLASFKYEGSNKIGLIDYIEVSAYSDTTVTNYAVKVFDKTNNKTVVETTGLTNKTLAQIDLGLLSNIPKNESILEVQVKGTGASTSKKIYLENVIVYYNN